MKKPTFKKLTKDQLWKLKGGLTTCTLTNCCDQQNTQGCGATCGDQMSNQRCDSQKVSLGISELSGGSKPGIKK